MTPSFVGQREGGMVTYKVANLRRRQLFLKLGLLLAAAAVAALVLVLVKT
jgi:hypothetical protein